MLRFIDKSTHFEQCASKKHQKSLKDEVRKYKKIFCKIPGNVKLLKKLKGKFNSPIFVLGTKRKTLHFTKNKRTFATKRLLIKLQFQCKLWVLSYFRFENREFLHFLCLIRILFLSFYFYHFHYFLRIFL